MAFADTLHRASWRGVPFGLEVGSQTVGRRVVQHDYPYRDTVWLEDQGKLPQEFRLIGFLIGNSAIYGGGDVISQRRQMESAAEATGAGILVHPVRGRLTVNLINLVMTERWDAGNVIELQFTFVLGGQQIFPAIAGALGDLVSKAADLADSAGLSAFSDAVLQPLESGLGAVEAMSTTASEWIGKVQSLASDATSLFGTVSQLGGANFGRYFNGRNAGFLAGLVSPYSSATSVADLIDLGANNRSAVASAAAALPSAISTLGAATTSADVARSAQAMVAALQASAADPADGVRILADLAAFTPISSAARTTSGIAVSDVLQRAAAAAVARASATYAPASADDAHAVRAQVLAPIEAVISRAGQTGEDAVFQAYRGVRKTVVDDLGARGGALARLADVALPAGLPAVVVAQRLYADAGRSDELVTEADPIHPMFMPLAFRALSD